MIRIPGIVLSVAVVVGFTACSLLSTDSRLIGTWWMAGRISSGVVTNFPPTGDVCVVFKADKSRVTTVVVTVFSLKYTNLYQDSWIVSPDSNYLCIATNSGVYDWTNRYRIEENSLTVYSGTNTNFGTIYSKQ